MNTVCLRIPSVFPRALELMGDGVLAIVRKPRSSAGERIPKDSPQSIPTSPRLVLCFLHDIHLEQTKIFDRSFLFAVVVRYSRRDMGS